LSGLVKNAGRVKKGKVARFGLELLVTCAVLEGVLRLAAPYLGSNMCNELVRTYSTNAGGGIYFFEPVSRSNFTFPNENRRVAVNGYQWNYQTDERGFRNPPGTEHEILLLGDSFMIGHGVEEPESAVAQLRQRYGWKIYNMARQGDTIWQEYMLFRFWFEELKPKHVIICAFGNDFWDIAGQRTPAEQEKPPEFDEAFLQQVRHNLTDPQICFQYGNWLTNSYLYRLGMMVKRRVFPESPPPAAVAVDKEAEFGRAGRYYTLLFEDMLKRCRAGGCTLDLVFLDHETDSDDWKKEQARLDVFFRALCTRNGVRYHTTHSLLRGHKELALPNDGHLNATGNRALADFFAKECQF